jgi:23S rRNA (uracil1939-C5)-methyltransferase
LSDTFELELTTMTHGGSALGRHDGRAIFVPYAIPGERVKVRIMQDKGRFAHAHMVEVTQPVPSRVTPPCKHFAVCGGCHWQHIDYGAQLEFKRQIVLDQMRRLGGFADIVVHPTLGSAEEWDYRSHVGFHRARDGRLGFIAVDDHTVIAIEECHIIRPELWEIAETENKRAAKAQKKISDFRQRVRLQVGTDGTERVISIGAEDEDMSAGFARVLTETTAVHYTIKDRVFRVSAGSFFQVNLRQAETLVDLVLERLQGSQKVLDLYAGVGLFTAFLAKQAQRVVMIESASTATIDAKVNLVDYPHVEWVEGFVENVLPRVEGTFDAAVIDPPRAGMKPKAIDALIKHAPQKIVYVSCDVATLARDAKLLTTNGYRLIDVQPVDMFPQTYHIECVAAFEKL